MDTTNILSKLENLSQFLIMKGGKKNTSKLIKVKRPYRTKSGKVAYRDTWVLPGLVKPDEKIHNDHKLHHKLPKEHPDYKKKELHPNFIEGRNKHIEAKKKPKAESSPEAKKKPKAESSPEAKKKPKAESSPPKIKDETVAPSTSQKKEKESKFIKKFSPREVQDGFHEYYKIPDKSKKSQALFDNVRKQHFKDGGTIEEWQQFLSGKIVPEASHPIIPHMAEAMNHLVNERQRKKSKKV